MMLSKKSIAIFSSKQLLFSPLFLQGTIVIGPKSVGGGGGDGGDGGDNNYNDDHDDNDDIGNNDDDDNGYGDDDDEQLRT